MQTIQEESVFLVTHGAKQRGVDPLMKPEEIQKVANLRQFLPVSPTCVVCGTGQRHQDVADALDLTPTQYSGVAGDPESLEIITVNGEGKREIVRLSYGKIIPLAMCSTPEDMEPAVKAKMLAAPANAIWCSGRPTMIALGLKNAKSGTVYRIDKADGKLIRIVEVSDADPCVVLEF